MFVFSTIFQHKDGIGADGRNLSLWKTKNHLTYKINSVAADDLATRSQDTSSYSIDHG